MQCDKRYYEADTGYMCWINKKPCNKNNCTLKHRFAKEFSKKVVKNIKAGEWMRKEGINPLTNDGQYADTTYKKAVEKMDRRKFFKSICRKVFKRGNDFLWKYFSIKMEKVVFRDGETNDKKVMKEGQYE